jgi:hypothetical protein
MEVEQGMSVLELSPEWMARTGDYIYAQARLLERTLYRYFFEDGSQASCLRALLAYQNDDGGFGNGIEPDLLCPQSTAIGAETAMYVLELLGCRPAKIVEPLARWVFTSQDQNGLILHPPEGLADYPHQPWWENGDDERVMQLGGILQKWGFHNPVFFARVRAYRATIKAPAQDSFYGYPHLTYLKYCAESEGEREQLRHMIAAVPTVLETHADHYPLFGRYWLEAAEYVDQETMDAQAHAFVEAIQEDGGLDAPYPELPWWRPIFTLDGLILLRKRGYL